MGVNRVGIFALHNFYINELSRDITGGIMYDVCELCKKKLLNRLTDTHHLIPRAWGGKETIELCRGCHTRVENMFRNFIMYGSFRKEPSKTSLEKRRLRRKKYYKTEHGHQKIRVYQNQYREKHPERRRAWDKKYQEKKGGNN